MLEHKTFYKKNIGKADAVYFFAKTNFYHSIIILAI